MKRVAVVTAGTGDVRDLQVLPGTTAKDVLDQMGLQGFILSKDNGQHPFGPNENIYAAIDDGEKLFAAAKTDVGIKILN